MTVKAARGMDVSQHPRRHKHSHKLIPPASRLEFVGANNVHMTLFNLLGNAC